MSRLSGLYGLLRKSWTTKASRLWHRIFRYAAGSAICFGVSELVLVLMFAPHLLGARGSAIVGSVAGIIPGYFLNRNWTWNRRGRSDFWREVVPYWATAIVSTIVAAVVIGMVNDAFIHESRATRTVLNATAFMVTYGFIFVAKFVLFERVLFPGANSWGADEPAPGSGSGESHVGEPVSLAEASIGSFDADFDGVADDAGSAARPAGDRVARGYTS